MPGDELDTLGKARELDGEILQVTGSFSVDEVQQVVSSRPFQIETIQHLDGGTQVILRREKG